MTDYLPVEGEGKGEVALSHSLTEAQLATSLELRGQLDTVIGRVKKSKLKLKDKVGLLSVLTKAHETLTKTERAASGMDTKHSSVVNAGVIVIPAKAGDSDWHDEARREVSRTKAES